MTATYIPFSIQDHPAASWSFFFLVIGILRKIFFYPREIDVPNGTYRVWVLVGDPINSSRTYLTCNSEVIFDEHNQQIIQVGLRQRSVSFLVLMQLIIFSLIKVRIEVNRGKIKFQSKPASDQKEITRILACTIMDEKLVLVHLDEIFTIYSCFICECEEYYSMHSVHFMLVANDFFIHSDQSGS
jgi:hypothetical protein